jgi:hypothetical protein
LERSLECQGPKTGRKENPLQKFLIFVEHSLERIEKNQKNVKNSAHKKAAHAKKIFYFWIAPLRIGLRY